MGLVNPGLSERVHPWKNPLNLPKIKKFKNTSKAENQDIARQLCYDYVYYNIEPAKIGLFHCTVANDLSNY